MHILKKVFYSNIGYLHKRGKWLLVNGNFHLSTDSSALGRDNSIVNLFLDLCRMYIFNHLFSILSGRNDFLAHKQRETERKKDIGEVYPPSIRKIQSYFSKFKMWMTNLGKHFQHWLKVSKKNPDIIQT